MIELEGVRVHNLKNVSLKLPLRSLIVVTGVSGSGKSSLAFDTLYAEGQRRYIDTLSPYTRQFLDPLERPAAERIGQIPPSIAIRQATVRGGPRSTVATATEIHDHLRLLYARAGEIVCPDCSQVVRRDSPEAVGRQVLALPGGARFQIAFPLPGETTDERCDNLSRAVAAGFRRGILDGETLPQIAPEQIAGGQSLWMIVDRLTAGKAAADRIVDSIEMAYRFGNERCIVLSEAAADDADSIAIDGRAWRVGHFSQDLTCETCGTQFIEPQPQLFSFSSALGACPECQGTGAVPTISFEHLVPDPSKSLRDGAIAPWNTPACRHELEELLALADDFGIPVDVPFSELQPEHLRLIEEGVPERDFGGLRGFFRWLERHRYQMNVRVLLNRWRSYATCRACDGARLQPQALAVRIRGHNIAGFCRADAGKALLLLDEMESALDESQRSTVRIVCREIRSRLKSLIEVGLGYLTLDRQVRTLSGGEARRVALTGVLGSGLMNMLYVLDEPSAGLHPRDTARIVAATARLRDQGNTLVVVEHDEAFIRAADEVVELGPGAGGDGGQIVFQGAPTQLAAAENSPTNDWLQGRTTVARRLPAEERPEASAWLTLRGARRHNLRNLTMQIPLGVLCAVSGVSGSGKSSLIGETLYPALCRALGQTCEQKAREYDGVDGAEAIDEVLRVTQDPLSRSSRSNPVTYMKAFDEIRQTFAQTPEARQRNFTARQFSFNTSGGGRCAVCQGLGTISVDMQFLPDMTMTCAECHGRRFQRDVLEVTYRGLNIADVLEMTVRDAFTYFRGQSGILRKLQFLRDLGLDYLPLGQSAATLSGGESQRLKLAARLASGTRARTLFLLDEPTVGLHAADVAKLVECFDRLIETGHSVVVIEHNPDLIRAADYVIDLGPGAADDGGRVVAAGTPDQIAGCAESVTGRFLRSR